MEACVLLGTGSSAKTGVFLGVSVNEGAIVDSGHGRLMGDHGVLVGCFDGSARQVDGR